MLAMHDLTKLSGAETKPLPQSEDCLDVQHLMRGAKE